MSLHNLVNSAITAEQCFRSSGRRWSIPAVLPFFIFLISFITSDSVIVPYRCLLCGTLLRQIRCILRFRQLRTALNCCCHLCWSCVEALLSSSLTGGRYWMFLTVLSQLWRWSSCHLLLLLVLLLQLCHQTTAVCHVYGVLGFVFCFVIFSTSIFSEHLYLPFFEFPTFVN